VPQTSDDSIFATSGGESVRKTENDILTREYSREIVGCWSCRFDHKYSIILEAVYELIISKSNLSPMQGNSILNLANIWKDFATIVKSRDSVTAFDGEIEKHCEFPARDIE